MEHPETYDEYEVYIPFSEAKDLTGKNVSNVTLEDVLLAGCSTFGIIMDPAWIEVSWRDTHSI